MRLAFSIPNTITTNKGEESWQSHFKWPLLLYVTSTVLAEGQFIFLALLFALDTPSISLALPLHTSSELMSIPFLSLHPESLEQGETFQFLPCPLKVLYFFHSTFYCFRIFIMHLFVSVYEFKLVLSVKISFHFMH